ncbi:structural maintenance of chromosomes protein 2-like protein, partial [Leptotrombidium deliense]
MHVKSVIIDGFKSYGQKTEINDFDHLFNAITGLNGSGKSNILDSICFVLGLSNMSLARCSNLRELIYKNGQTGVSKASVTITFDNKEKERSPMGYEQYDDIVIRREVNLNSRTKYFINGFNASNSQVSDLFHSVQLNINNPHFLIMQGRITKVLNMRPHE